MRVASTNEGWVALLSIGHGSWIFVKDCSLDTFRCRRCALNRILAWLAFVFLCFDLRGDSLRNGAMVEVVFRKGLELSLAMET